jgi:hypothetical protein
VKFPPPQDQGGSNLSALVHAYAGLPALEALPGLETNRRFSWLTTLLPHTKALYRNDLLWRTLRAVTAPGPKRSAGAGITAEAVARPVGADAWHQGLFD